MLADGFLVIVVVDEVVAKLKVKLKAYFKWNSEKIKKRLLFLVEVVVEMVVVDVVLVVLVVKAVANIKINYSYLK